MSSARQIVLWETIGCSISTHSDAGATRTRYWLSGRMRGQSRTAAIGSARVFYFVPITRNYKRQAAYLLLPLRCTSLSLFRGQRLRMLRLCQKHREVNP